MIADSVGVIGGSGNASGGPNSIVGGRGSAVGGQGSAVGGQGSAVGGQGSAVGGRGSAVGGRGSAVGGQGSAVGGQGSAVSSRGGRSSITEIGATRPVPGWPSAWIPPRVAPQPFDPPRFVLSADQLIRAVGACSPDQLSACRRGDVAATAVLLMEIVKQVHADPRERNIYLNPRRSDLALVLVPGRWEARELTRVGSDLFDRIVHEMCVPTIGIPPAVRAAVRSARANYRSHPAKVTTSSLPALSAHLENMHHQTSCGEDWLGSSAVAEDSEVRCLGTERCEHISETDPTYMGLACMIQVYGEEDITPENADRLATQAIVQYSRLALNGHPENLSLLPGPGDTVYAHTRRCGWVQRPRAEVAREHAAIMHYQVEGSLEEAEKTVLRGLLPSLRGGKERILDELGRPDGPIITKYLETASQYYLGLPPAAASPSDERYQARDILLRHLSQGVAPGPSAPTAALTSEDLDEFLEL